MDAFATHNASRSEIEGGWQMTETRRSFGEFCEGLQGRFGASEGWSPEVNTSAVGLLREIFGRRLTDPAYLTYFGLRGGPIDMNDAVTVSVLEAVTERIDMVSMETATGANFVPRDKQFSAGGNLVPDPFAGYTIEVLARAAEILRVTVDDTF